MPLYLHPPIFNVDNRYSEEGINRKVEWGVDRRFPGRTYRVGLHKQPWKENSQHDDHP